jgi:MerR family transcriptional regulator, light-induced transcriptional regulator
LEGGNVAYHPIGVVADRTGLTPDVIRVWERRYGVVEPSRGSGGQRQYSDADVERLLLLKQATQGGRGIGSVAGLGLEELAELVRSDQEARSSREDGAVVEVPDLDLDEAIELAKRIDGERLEDLLRKSAAILGVPRFLEGAVAPLLRRVGDEWHAGQMTVAQEHLVTATVHRVVVSVLGTLPREGGAPILLVAGLAGERHEMGGLLVAAVAASEGWRVIYLGANLPALEIVGAAVQSGARAVALSLVYVEDGERTVAEVRMVRDGLPRSVPLLLGGVGARDLGELLRHPGTYMPEGFGGLRQALRAWSDRN